MSGVLDRTTGKVFVPSYFADIVGADTKYLETLLTPEDRAKLGSDPDTKSLLTACYKSNALETLHFLVEATDLHLKEAADRYRCMLYTYSMTENDPKKAQDYYEKLIELEKEYGKLIEEPVSDIITSLPKRPSLREQMKAHIKELQRSSC